MDKQLTPELERVLCSAARYVSHRDMISTAGAHKQINRHPEVLADVILELQALKEKLTNPKSQPPNKDQAPTPN